MRMPKITLGIVFYNQRNFIKDAIDSVKNQTIDVWECIIYDDGSSDGSDEIILHRRLVGIIVWITQKGNMYVFWMVMICWLKMLLKLCMA